MSSTYTYQPLINSQTQIRLLKLDHPPTALENTRDKATARHAISSSLSHVSLDVHPSYKALSYAWGALVSPKVPILIDGNAVMITQNLYEALEWFQTLSTCPDTWVDAVCINQADDEEKRTQVPLMHRIYGQAEEVLIWLGPAADKVPR